MPLPAPAPWHTGAVTTPDAAPGLCRAGAGFMIEVVGLGTPLCQRLAWNGRLLRGPGPRRDRDLVAAVPNAGRYGVLGAAAAGSASTRSARRF